jgi:hypothetical protein
MVQELTDQTQIAKGGDGKGTIASPLGDHKYALSVLKPQSGGAADNAMLAKHGFPPASFGSHGDQSSEKDMKKFTDKMNQRDTEAQNKKLEERAVSRLSPKDQAAYKEEDRVRKAYEDSSTHYGRGPTSPVHDKVAQAVKEANQQAQQKALEGMSPEQRNQLQTEQTKYNKDNKETYHNGVKPIWKYAPEPGTTMRDYDRRVREEVDKDLQRHPK